MAERQAQQRPDRPDVNGPVEKLITELQQSRKMHMIEHLQAKLLEDQRRSLKHLESVQSGLSIMRAGALRSRPSTSPAANMAAATVQDLGLHRMSFSETLRAEVEASRSACGIAPEVSRTKTAPEATTATMAQIPEQPELERPKTTPGTCGNSSQSLSTRGLKSMKTAGTVKFQGTSGSGPLGVSWTDEEEEFYRFHEECFYASNVRDLSGLSDRALFRQKGQSKVLSQSSDVITFDFGDSGRRLAIADREGQLSVWNVADREKLWSSSISSCTTMAFSLCGKFIAAVNNEGVVHFWNLSSDPQSTPLQTFSAASKVNALAFSADKGLALSTAEKVVLLAAPSLQEVAVLPQTGDVRELSFSPDGAFLVAAGLHVDPRSSIMVEDGDPSAGAVFWSVTDSFRRLGSMVFRQVLRVTTFRPDGKLLALAGDNKLITLLDVLNDFDHDGDLPCGQPVRALAWSPNLRCLASGGEDRMVTVWDLASKHVLFQMDPMKDWIFKLAWSATGLLAFSHLGAHGVRLAPLEEVQDKKEITLERPNTEEDLAEKEETPQFVFLVKVASTPGGPVEPKKVLEEEGFNVNIARDRVDLDPIALDLSCKNPGLQVAAQDPTYVTGHHLVSCSFTPHETLMIAGEDIFEFEVANRSKNREIHLRDVAKALAISPCGGYVAVANAFLVTVHRLMSKGQEAVLNQKVTSNVVCLAFSAQQFLAVGTMEKKVLVFHLEDKKEPEILSVQVNSLCFSPTGNLLAVPGSDGSGKVSLWQVAREGCEFAGLVKTRNAAHVACFTEAGKVLAVGCEDARVVLLAVEYGFKCWSELRCNFPVHYLTLSGSFLAAGGDRDICVFNISSSQIALQLPRQEERIQGISLSTSGSLLACCFRGHVTLLPLESVTEVTQASMKVPDNKDRYKSRGTVTSLSLKSSPSDVMHTIHLSFADVQAGEDASLQVSRSLKSTGSCSNLDMGDAEEGRRSFHKSISLPFESKVGEDSAGTEAYIPVDEDGEVSPPPWLLKPRISVTDMSQGEVSRCTTPGEKEEDPEARALRKRQLLARDLGLDPAIQSKISIAGREGEGCGPIKLKHKDEVQSLSFHPSGSSLVAGGYDQELMLWNADSHSPAAQHHIESEIVAVCFSPCGEYVFCGDTEREINVFKANTLELLAAEVLKEQFGCLAGISSPTQLLAVGCTAVVKIFSVPKLEEVISLEHGGQVHSLSFSPSLGMLAAAGGIDLTNGLLDYSAKDHRDCMKAMVWKSTDMAGLWDEVTTINYKDFCHAAAFSPSGTALALAGEDRLISILSVGKNFQKVEELPCGAGIRCLSWSHSSRLLASAGEDMRVSVWDVLFKRVVLHLPKADDWLCSLSFSADSKWLATCGYGQDTVDLWPIEVEEKEFSW